MIWPTDRTYGMFDFDHNTVKVDVDGAWPVSELAKSLHNSMSAVEAADLLLALVDPFLDWFEKVVATFVVLYLQSEIYRLGIEIQPTKYISASGEGTSSGRGSISS